jgi:hypothetical protein
MAGAWHTRLYKYVDANLCKMEFACAHDTNKDTSVFRLGAQATAQ